MSRIKKKKSTAHENHAPEHHFFIGEEVCFLGNVFRRGAVAADLFPLFIPKMKREKMIHMPLLCSFLLSIHGLEVGWTERNKRPLQMRRRNDWRAGKNKTTDYRLSSKSFPVLLIREKDSSSAHLPSLTKSLLLPTRMRKRFRRRECGTVDRWKGDLNRRSGSPFTQPPVGRGMS
jgi:hypothetical protein